MRRIFPIFILGTLAACGQATAPSPRIPSSPDTVLMLMSEHLGPVPAGVERTLAFHVMRRGDALTDFDVTHEKLLHLIVVRNDLEHFQHLHPTLDPATGTFTVPLTLPAPGTYAVYADVQPAGGDLVTVRETLTAETASEPSVPELDEVTSDIDGYTVTPTVASALPTGIELMLGYFITKNGVPVTDLQDYLGAKGHMVILRAKTLEYLHAHPMDRAHGHGEFTDLDPGEVEFLTVFDHPGTYAVFAQFRPEGHLITVRHVFEVVAPPEDAELHMGH